jgi:hypothetical protein
MSETTAHFLSGQLDAYTESWHHDHIDALACWELEARLEVALALFHVIRRMDEEMCQQVAAGRLRWDVPAADQLLGFYRAWEAPADQIADRVSALRAKGFEVQGGQAFEQATLQAKSTLNIPMDRLEHSAQQAQEGKLRPVGEVRNELRHKSDPRC